MVAAGPVSAKLLLMVVQVGMELLASFVYYLDYPTDSFSRSTTLGVTQEAGYAQVVLGDWNNCDFKGR